MELNDNNTKAYDFVKAIFNLDNTVNSDNSEENIGLLYKYMEENGYDENVPYPAIAEYVYENENIDSEIADTVDRYFSDDYPKFAEKFNKHVNLSLTQKKYIQKEVNSKIDSAQEEVKGLNNRYKELEEKADKMASEYISILGIFSALIFGLFGGFNALTSSFNIFIETNTYGQAIFYLSILSLALVTFVYFLLHWIGIMIDKPIHDTSSEYTPGAISAAFSAINTLLRGEEKKKDPFKVKHETYLVVASTLLLIALSGMTLNVIEVYFNIENYIYLLLLGLLVSIGFIGYFLSRLLKKED